MKKHLLVIGVFALLILLAPTVSFAADCLEKDEDCWISQLKSGDAKQAMAAAMALADIGTEKSVKPLIIKLSHQDKYMATAARYALVQIGEPAVEDLKKAMESKNNAVRKYASHALAEIGANIYDELSEMTRDQDPTVRYRAFKSLQQLKDKRAVADALIALKDRQRNVKIEAIKLLGMLEDPRCIGTLIRYGMMDLSPEVSLESAAVLIRFGGLSVEPLLEQLQNQPEYVKLRYVYVLGEIARRGEDEMAKKAKMFLIHFVEVPQREVKVKQVAVSKLGDIGDPAAVPALQTLMKRLKGNPEYAELLQVTVRTLEKLTRKETKEEKKQ